MYEQKLDVSLMVFFIILNLFLTTVFTPLNHEAIEHLRLEFDVISAVDDDACLLFIFRHEIFSLSMISALDIDLLWVWTQCPHMRSRAEEEGDIYSRGSFSSTPSVGW